MCINDEGLFFLIFFSPSKHRSCWVAELSRAGGTTGGASLEYQPGGGWKFVAGQMLAAEGCLGLRRQHPSLPPGMPIAQNVTFYFKHVPAVFPALDGMLRPRHPRASPLCMGPCCGAGPSHIRPAELAVATSVCQSLPVPPELINKTSGVILAPGTGLSPGAQSCSFSVSPQHRSSLLFPS